MELPFSQQADFIGEHFFRRDPVSRTRIFDIAVVLGSGLGGFTNHLEKKFALSTAHIPGYPASSVPGHRGEIVSAYLGRRRLLVFSGRVHYYETVSTIDASVTAIVSHLLGIKRIILTNAAGILKTTFSPGSLMLIDDQINLTSGSVLADLQVPVTNLNPVYDRRLIQIASKASLETGVPLERGTYIGLTGPTYETEAEVKFYRQIGGDAIGMSTIHEAMFARYAGMEVMGISCLTNYSTGIRPQKLLHKEVTDIGRRVDKNFSRLLMSIIAQL